MPVTLPNTIINGAPTDASKVQENFDALETFANTVESDLAAAEADRTADRATDRAYTDTQSAAAQAVADNHIGDGSTAHAASAVSFSATGTVSSTNVQAAIAEVASERVSATDSLDTRLDALEAAAGWSNQSLSNGWVDYSGRQDAEVRKDGDEVQMRGQIRNGTFTDGTVVLTLASGRRPPADDVFPASGAGTGSAYFFVKTNGQVEVYGLVNANGLGLSGIRFSTS